MTVEGTVKNVTDFGAFIDLGGADGLLHISEMMENLLTFIRPMKIGQIITVICEIPGFY